MQTSRESLDRSDVAARCTLREVKTLEFLEHHFAKTGHRDLLSLWPDDISLGCWRESHAAGGITVEQRSNRRLQQNGAEPESPERTALEALVGAVVGAAYEVSNVLGAGFREKLYESTLLEELRLRGIPTAAQATFPVAYNGKHTGTYAAELVVDGRLLVEITCVEQLTNEHLAQCINYLKASNLHLALLINF